MWAHSACNDDGELAWPEDPSEVPEWRLEREAWADACGVKLPSYRTKRDADLAIELCAMACPGPLPDPDPPEPALPVDKAAELFLGSIQNGIPSGVAEYSADELSASYEEWCAVRNLLPSSIDHVKAAMALLPGVYRDKQAVYVDGKRRRVVRWVISPAETSDSHIEPLPLKIAA